jgi:hypothetical protein
MRRDIPAADAEEIVRLDRLQRRWLLRLERDPVRRELVADKAREILARRLNSGNRPLLIDAWLRAVVFNLCQSDKHVPKHPMASIDALAAPPTSRGDPTEDDIGVYLQRDWLHEQAGRIKRSLPKRLRRIFRAVLCCTGTHELARMVGEDKSNVRRALALLGDHVKDLIERGYIPPPPPSL